MGHPSVWKTLEEMIADLRKKKVRIPSSIMNDLKNAKLIINISEADPGHGENMQKIEQYLGNIQAFLVTEGQKTFGQEYVDRWLSLIEKTARKVADREEKEIRFVAGAPRQQSWIRISPSDELPLDKLKTLIEESNLSYTVQTDGNILVYGKDRSIKDFVKKLAARRELKTRKQ